ncbi:hypothetical protein COCC4DRAFT_66237 [Bipolaris maydis ATCC 48331]|uniref:Uncharacterized protein n=2 Tax=Cochliobolus heterostrophus TaxID=5016 RepID=M2ULS3_COCH5|nr:uncharacterized protein COCC4DRAFT_66237 [Bipolaris maydis ATCC 48331]EMD94571.1 hypothetical protein COCHEDRAFT_1221935 [Bipolaris maydis C5]KAH7556235.1 hypothetical protein BM1_06761 [Bipolaris maydis]ENH99656.1 hypothetical protein COCC4DRAFT_66237 [Bipolaris maydis ATCC 48331]KAJ5029010.1 hypothetical protein J3E73DRAFT_226380 [Bipolaris maydis]KAJ5062265.1 hypothetical protein J3E74DRAFT_417574 [Bipolaris maydis]
MTLDLRAKGNAQGQRIAAGDGRKRKRDGTSNLHSNSVPKKRKGNSIDFVPDNPTEGQKITENKRILDEFRIKFHERKYCPERPGNVPEEHQTKFQHIQQLGQMIYESYAVQPRPDITNKPWELENKTRATRVSQVAVESRSTNVNEDTWRMALENRIFERFEIEVACQQCRKRRWQSLVEVNSTESNSRTKNLAERQKHRSVCECEPFSKQYSILPTGLTDIFTTRIGERSVIQNDPENHRQIEMQPDRIYGLKTTDAIEKILERPHNSYLGKDPEIDELLNRLTISCNPDSGGRASIYPFLVMEAKSLKSNSDFRKIEIQTAVPIRNHLYLQLKLQEDEFNRMPIPGGPLSWFLAYVGEMWRVYGCYVTKSGPDDLPYYNIVLLWEGSITGYDEALQLVLIMDYIVDWARDIFRPSIIRQLMSVVDKGSRSSYTIIEEPDILSIPGYANSWCGDRLDGTITGAETIGVPNQPAFDAMDSTIESSFQPLFETTGEHVDFRVWECAKYEARVRGLYITGNDTAANEHLAYSCYRRLKTVYMSRCWFLLPHAQDVKTIEQAWTGSQEIKDVQDMSPQRILISLYVQYRKDGGGMPVRELTYLALTESAAKKVWALKNILEQNKLIASADELGLKLREAWASSNENYFQRYATSQTSVLCATASDFDRLSDRVVLGFHDSRDATNYARRLNTFIQNTCEKPRAQLYKIYAPCFRYTKTIHSLTVEPHSSIDPTQACVFVNTEAMLTGICAYITKPASEEVNDEWVIRHLVQMVLALWDYTVLDEEKFFYTERFPESKILLWIVSDPQWNSYISIKSTLTMPGMNNVHESLTWFRKVLLRHKCGTGTFGRTYREGYRNIQYDIMEACKKCDFKYSHDRHSQNFEFCDEDFMPE